MEKKNKLTLGSTVELKREALKYLIRNISFYTREGVFDLVHAKEYFILLGAFTKKFPMRGTIKCFGARESRNERLVGVNFSSKLGSTGILYYNEEYLNRIYKKRK